MSILAFSASAFPPGCFWDMLLLLLLGSFPSSSRELRVSPVLDVEGPVNSTDSCSSWCRGSLGVFTVGVEVASEMVGVDGAVISECGVDGAFIDSASSSFFFFRVLFFLPFSSGIMSEYSWMRDWPDTGMFAAWGTPVSDPHGAPLPSTGDEGTAEGNGGLTWFCVKAAPGRFP